MPWSSAGGECLDGTAEENVDLRIALLGDQTRQRLAGGEAHEIDVDAGRLLERLQHRPRIILGPDRIGADGFGGGGAPGRERRGDGTDDTLRRSTFRGDRHGLAFIPGVHETSRADLWSA